MGTHYAEIQDDRENVLWHGRVKNDREGLDFLIGKIRTVERSNSQETIGIFMNATGNYHIPLKYFLEQNGYAGKTHLVDARRTAYQRESENLGKEKSDAQDAHILAATPFKSKKALERNDHERLPLSEVTREREIIVKNVTRIKSLIHADLSAVFPEFSSSMNTDSKTGMALLEEFTTPANVSNLDQDKLLRFMQKTGRNNFSMKDVQNLIETAKRSIGIPDAEGAYSFRIRINLRRLKNELSALKDVEEEIESRSSGNGDMSHLKEMKGIGTVNAAVIVSEIGDIKQFGSALKLQSYGGKCPDITGSGGKTQAKGVTRVRNSHLSNAVYESAVSLVLHRNHEFHELFQREVTKKKSNVEACITVGKRLLFHVHSIMKNGKPYKERFPMRQGEGGTSTGA